MPEYTSYTGGNYATRYEKAVSDVIRQGSLTGILETPNVNWTGAKTFTERTLKASGFKPHTRDTGWNQGKVEDAEIPYTLEFDRDIEFFVDQADVDETNELLTAGNVTKAFLTQQAIPEMDAYRFSKIATKAITLGQSATETVSKANIYTKLKAAFLPIRKYGASNMITFMSSEAMDALEQAEGFSRSISTEKIADIETRVTSVDGVKLIEVWDDARFKTAFDFTEGFKETTGTKGLNFMVLSRGSIIAKAKIASIYLFAPGKHTKGDGWLYQNRLYHDLFVRELAKDGIYISNK